MVTSNSRYVGTIYFHDNSKFCSIGRSPSLLIISILFPPKALGSVTVRLLPPHHYKKTLPIIHSCNFSKHFTSQAVDASGSGQTCFLIPTKSEAGYSGRTKQVRALRHISYCWSWTTAFTACRSETTTAVDHIATIEGSRPPDI